MQTIVCRTSNQTYVLLYQINGEKKLGQEKIFGQILKKYRKKINLSQEKLSQESELDRSYISLLERGLRQPSLTTILVLSKALKTTAAKLIAEVEENLK